MQTWKQLIKPAAEHALTAFGFARRARGRSRDRVAILAYHNVVPDGARPVGDVSLHLPLTSFRRQMDLLGKYYDIVSLDQLSQPPSSDRPRAAITFDDAYRGAVELALPDLVARGYPSTVFVCPGLLGGGPFWWDRLTDGGPSGLDPDVRSQALGEFQGRDDLLAERFPDQPELPAYLLPGTADDLVAAAKADVVSFASHTWSHPNLTQIDGGRLAEELQTSRTWMEEQCPGRVLPEHLSFPYGLWNANVVRAAAQIGYRWLYRVDGGPAVISVEQDPLVIPRINIPAGVSLRGFELRVAGFLGQ